LGQGINIFLKQFELIFSLLILKNLKAVDYLLTVFINQLLIFKIKNHNQNYKKFIGFIPFLKMKNS
jgi:hypothetical protein